MIRRVYICDACEDSFEFYMDVNQKHKKKCPSCGKNKLYQDLSGVYIGVRDVKTLGQLADRKIEKMGRYEYEKKEKEEIDRQKSIYNRKKDIIEKAMPKVKVPNFETKDPIPETPSYVKKAIDSQTDKNKKSERIKKYILEGK